MKIRSDHHVLASQSFGVRVPPQARGQASAAVIAAVELLRHIEESECRTKTIGEYEPKMTAIMFGTTGDGELLELKETGFEKELDFQELLTRHSALLAGDQMNPTDPRRFVLLTAEAGIAIAEGGGRYFSLDHLYIDQDGIPTLVEVKRSTDSRLRREVIGQMLEYAANACAYWDVERLRSMLERRCEKAGLKVDEELEKLSTGPERAADDRQKVAQNLNQQRLRLVSLPTNSNPRRKGLSSSSIAKCK